MAKHLKSLKLKIIMCKLHFIVSNLPCTEEEGIWIILEYGQLRDVVQESLESTANSFPKRFLILMPSNNW